MIEMMFRNGVDTNKSIKEIVEENGFGECGPFIEALLGVALRGLVEDDLMNKKEKGIFKDLAIASRGDSFKFGEKILIPTSYELKDWQYFDVDVNQPLKNAVALNMAFKIVRKDIEEKILKCSHPSVAFEGSIPSVDGEKIVYRIAVMDI